MVSALPIWEGSSGQDDEDEVEPTEESSDSDEASATAMRLASTARGGVEAAEASGDGKRPAAAIPPIRSMDDLRVVTGSTGLILAPI